MKYTERAGPPPRPLKPLPRGIPAELRELPQWVCWRYGERVDRTTGEVRFTKEPINPRRTGKMASTTDPTTWTDLDQAIKVYEAHPRIDGIGFVFSPTDPYLGADFDGCVRKDGGIDPWVLSWLEQLGGYAEYSPSGTGVHAIVKGALPGKGKKRIVEGHKVEVYDRERFFTFTGAALREGSVPGDAQGPVDALYRMLTPPPNVEREIRRLRTPVLGADEILDKARTAASGWKFARLYDKGDWEGLKYPSQSEADSALIYSLIFWSGGDRATIIELFERSALYRSPREKRGNYVERTVDGALASYRGGYYDPKHKGDGIREALVPYFRLLEAPVWSGGKRPSARKVLAAILLAACEHGTRTQKGVRVGLDVRTLMEVAHVSSKTLLYNSLPLLVKDRIVRWSSKGDRRNAGAFLLPLPVNSDSNTHFPHAFSVLLPIKLGALGNEERRELLRASHGRSPSAPIPRVGNSCEALLEHMVGTPGNRLSLEDLAERTGRRKHNVRASMRKLSGLNLVVELRRDEYALPADFWDLWEQILVDSGVVRSERVRREQHEKARLDRAGWFQLWEKGEEFWVRRETGERMSRSEALVRVGRE